MHTKNTSLKEALLFKFSVSEGFMKYLATALLVALFAVPASVSASNSAGKVFGAGIDCTFNDGSVKQLPRALCKAYGGSHK
ncbi:hypothetical protein VPR01S_02_00340 [Vibrio proteolyticus NBRC 13287]|uniref:Uncharacterized protein n=3 Tax=Vibrionaceae TaxID=641 RepID=U3BGG9_VIBPR|nr:hypothetical protein VPR01S_02_00340 [Vibrio proteolyticus NBRC 13287]